MTDHSRCVCGSEDFTEYENEGRKCDFCGRWFERYNDYIDIVFSQDDDDSPYLTFVEVEDKHGKGIGIGLWKVDGKNYRLRISAGEIESHYLDLFEERQNDRA